MPACMQVFKKITYFHTCNTSSLLLIQRECHSLLKSQSFTCYGKDWVWIVSSQFVWIFEVQTGLGQYHLTVQKTKEIVDVPTKTTGISISPLERRLCSLCTASYHLCHSWHDQSPSLGKYPYWSSITPAATYMYVSEPPSSSCCNKIKICKPNNQLYQLGMCYFRSGYGYLELFCMRGEFTAALQCWSLVLLFYTEPKKGDLFS